MATLYYPAVLGCNCCYTLSQRQGKTFYFHYKSYSEAMPHLNSLCILIIILKKSVLGVKFILCNQAADD